MRNADMPAMPIPDDAESGGSLPLIALDKTGANGLTKREYFAGLAMNRILAKDERGVMSPEITAQASVRMADALLAELDKESQS